MRVFETSKAPLSVIRFKFWRCPPILLIMPVIVVTQETRDFFKHEETRVAGIIPCLPIVQDPMQFPFFVTEKQDDRVCDVAEQHHKRIEKK
jgi:hypothetical protein